MKLLKNINIMTETEKKEVIKKAEEWMQKYPQLKAVVKSWQDAPVKDFDEGVELCSCLRQARSFVDNAYKFSASKCLDMIYLTLNEITQVVGGIKPRTEEEKKTKSIKAFVPKQPAPDENGKTNRISPEQRKEMENKAMDEEKEMDKWRPQNLAGYMHLLPQNIQKECNDVQKKFYMPLREYRTRLESLVENPNATDEQRREMAERLVNTENELANFWNKVDAEYKKATGQQLPDTPETGKRIQDYTKEDIDKMPESEVKESVKKQRIENNKKYLRRQDLPDNEETKQQLSLRAEELQQWGVTITKKQMENMKHFGVTLVTIHNEVENKKNNAPLFD